MAIQLKLHTKPDVPVEAFNINTNIFAKLSNTKISSLLVMHGNVKAEIGDFFKVSGKQNNKIVLTGNLKNIKHVGTAMSHGEILIKGNIGSHVGAEMSGGKIVVEGNAADWVAPGISGGQIIVKGNAGHCIGTAYRGAHIGITGGEIVIHGNAKNEVGGGMRNGVIAVGGSCGDFAGVNMKAGSIFLLGETGIRAGAGMERGTIAMMRQPELLPTFSYDCVYRPIYLRIYLMYLKNLGLKIEDKKIVGNYMRWSGDSVELNRGEILVFTPPEIA
mgnify:CR=1 FL=1